MMNKLFKRVLSVALATLLVMTAVPMAAPVFAAYENTHVNTGDMAEDIVAVAKTQLGYHEGSLAGTTSGSNNYTKYGVWYGDYIGDSSFDYGQWCAMFVSWCANQAGIPNDIVYYHAYCPYGVTWFKNKGQWQNSAYQGGSYVPKRGDIIYFKNSSGIAGHIGIVDYVSGSTVYTLEGNTSSAVYDPNGNVATDKSYALSSSYILGYGIPAYVTSPGSSSAEKLGTYRVTASSLNVRSGAGTSYGIVGELLTDDLVVVTELSGDWGKVTLSDGTTGWCSIGTYGDYIGMDVLDCDIKAAWSEDKLAYTTAENGSVTLTNNSTTDPIAVDFATMIPVGNRTTPYLNISVSRHSGGYYFGLTQTGSGYFMMRECTSGDELVNATTATYMQTDENLQIDIGYWWAPEEGYQIDNLRLYLDAASSVTVNYCYFAESPNVVTSTAYNMRNGGSAGTVVTTPDPINLMLPDTLAIDDRTKTGSYSYENGTLTVVSGSDSGYEVSFSPNVSFSPETLSRWLFSVNTDVRFDIVLTVTTADGDRDFGLVSDFYMHFCDTPDNGYIPAMNGSAGLDLLSCYTWNEVLPTDGVSTIKKATVRVGGSGTVVLGDLQVAATDALTLFTDTVVKSDSSTASSPSITVGDVTQDGEVTSLDARRILSYLVDSTIFNADQLAAADVNGDGAVTSLDARAVLKSLL